MNGLEAWQKLATLFVSYNPNIEWNNDRELWEISHFFFQHVRIPFKNQGSKAVLQRLIQVAYNSGQFIASIDTYKKHGLYSWISYYHKHDMANIESYITKASLQQSKLFDKIQMANMIAEIKNFNSLK